MLGIFKKKDAFDAKAYATAQILEGLQNFELPARLEGNRIHTGLNGIEIEVNDIKMDGMKLANQTKLASLIISTTLGDFAPVTISENVSHFDQDAQKAIDIATFTYLMSVFVTVAALVDPEAHPGHMASVAEHVFPDKEGQERRWRIATSPALCFALGETTEDQDSPDAERPDTRPLMEPVFQDIARFPRLHAVKIFLLRMPGSTGGDCTINGETSEPLGEYLSSYDWPRASPGGTLRQYHLLWPLDAA